MPLLILSIFCNLRYSPFLFCKHFPAVPMTGSFGSTVLIQIITHIICEKKSFPLKFHRKFRQNKNYAKLFLTFNHLSMMIMV